MMLIFFILHSSVTLFLAFVVYRSIIALSEEESRLIYELNIVLKENRELKKKLGFFDEEKGNKK